MLPNHFSLYVPCTEVCFNMEFILVKSKSFRAIVCFARKRMVSSHGSLSILRGYGLGLSWTGGLCYFTFLFQVSRTSYIYNIMLSYSVSYVNYLIVAYRKSSGSRVIVSWASHSCTDDPGSTTGPRKQIYICLVSAPPSWKATVFLHKSCQETTSHLNRSELALNCKPVHLCLNCCQATQGSASFVRLKTN